MAVVVVEEGVVVVGPPATGAVPGVPGPGSRSPRRLARDPVPELPKFVVDAILSRDYTLRELAARFGVPAGLVVLVRSVGRRS